MAKLRGATLVELLLALALIALLIGVAVPGVRGPLDRLAVQSAATAVAGSTARARIEAVARGRAAVEIDVATGRLRLVVDGPVDLETVDLRAEYGVRVSTIPPLPVVRLEYNALGLGVMASRSLRFRRGTAESGLVVSSYGRVRPW
ncbi:MAG: hypothetical protein ACRELV_03160 [Longimicrobiales bacterium]